MINKRIYFLNFQNKYGLENRRNKDRGWLVNAKYKEMNVKWSIRIINSFNKFIKTIESNMINKIREKFIFI